MSELNSSAFSSIQDSIEHAAENKLLLSNVSVRINVKNEMIMDDDHIFKKYEDVIFQYLIDVELKKENQYRPEYLSQEVYGTPDLWYLILWVNRMSSFHDFTRPSVKVFDPTQMGMLNKIIEREKGRVLESRENPILIEDLVLRKIVV